jgi:hypothetical protein
MNDIYFLDRNMTTICEVPEVTDASYGSETWITRKRDESRIVSRNESASVRRKMEKQDGKPNQEITQDLQIHSVLRQNTRTRHTNFRWNGRSVTTKTLSIIDPGEERIGQSKGKTWIKFGTGYRK